MSSAESAAGRRVPGAGADDRVADPARGPHRVVCGPPGQAPLVWAAPDRRSAYILAEGALQAWADTSTAPRTIALRIESGTATIHAATGPLDEIYGRIGGWLLELDTAASNQDERARRSIADEHPAPAATAPTELTTLFERITAVADHLLGDRATATTAQWHVLDGVERNLELLRGRIADFGVDAEVHEADTSRIPRVATGPTPQRPSEAGVSMTDAEIDSWARWYASAELSERIAAADPRDSYARPRSAESTPGDTTAVAAAAAAQRAAHPVSDYEQHLQGWLDRWQGHHDRLAAALDERATLLENMHRETHDLADTVGVAYQWGGYRHAELPPLVPEGVGSDAEDRRRHALNPFEYETELELWDLWRECVYLDRQAAIIETGLIEAHAANRKLRHQPETGEQPDVVDPNQLSFDLITGDAPENPAAAATADQPDTRTDPHDAQSILDADPLTTGTEQSPTAEPDPESGSPDTVPGPAADGRRIRDLLTAATAAGRHGADPWIEPGPATAGVALEDPGRRSEAGHEL